MAVARSILQKRAGDDVAIMKLRRATECLKGNAMLAKHATTELGDDGIETAVNKVVNADRALDLSRAQAMCAEFFV